MKKLKIFATLFCFVAVMSVNAQTTVKQDDKTIVNPKKDLSGKKVSRLPKNQVKMKEAAKNEGMQSDPKVKADNSDRVGTDGKKIEKKPAPDKNAKPTDKTKMKSVGRPVKVTPK